MEAEVISLRARLSAASAQGRVLLALLLAALCFSNTVGARDARSSALATERATLADAERDMARYLRAARSEQRKAAAGTSAAMPPALDLRRDQARWQQSRAEQCSGDDVAFWVGKGWQQADARREGELEAARCQVQMTRQRTHWLWRNWLVGVGTGQAVLPEPPLP